MKTFVTVIEAGNFSNAGRQMGLSPSAISRIVKRLESRLSVTLLQRSPRSVISTHEGKIYYEHAVQTLLSLEKAEQVGQSLAGGVIRVRSIPTFALYQLAPLLPKFRHLYPELNIEFLLGNENIGPLDGGVDIAIRSGKMQDSSLVSTKITQTQWSFCASPAYIKKYGVPRTARELQGHKCLGFSMITPWNEWPTEASGHLHKVQSVMTANEGTMLLELVKQGLGIARLANYHIHNSLKEGSIIRILPDVVGIEEPIHIVFRKEMQANSRVRALIHFLKNEFRISSTGSGL